jgi:hypothetical protein
MELFQSEQITDRTPGALLFFSALYDPAAITAMQTMLSELKHLRGVAECKEHLDFSSLRRRILVCIANVPSLERLLAKFSRMHSSWTQSRAKVFSSRNQAGGDADTSYACPLCNHDSRWLAASTVPNRATLTEDIMSKNPTNKPKTLRNGVAHAHEQIEAMKASSSLPILPPSMNDYRKNITNKIKVRNW